MPQHVLSLREFTGQEIKSIIELAVAVKKNPQDYYNTLEKKGLLLLFQKTSTRTSLSYQTAINQLGGYAVTLDWNTSNFSISPIQYEVSYASRNSDVIMARLLKYSDMVELAKYSKVPVINGCCEKYHPSQALADLLTIYETLGTFEGATITYVGVHNNVANSLVAGCMKVGVKLILVTPIVNEASWDQELMDEAYASGYVKNMDNLAEAAAQSDFVYTDTWVDMQHFHDPSYAEERDRRMAIMSNFSISRKNLGSANPYIMHDMPIHPDIEIEEALIESEKAIIYQQAENRMHAEKALLLHLLQEKKEETTAPATTAQV